MSPDRFRLFLAVLLTVAFLAAVWMLRYDYGRLGTANLVRTDRWTGHAEYVDNM